MESRAPWAWTEAADAVAVADAAAPPPPPPCNMPSWPCDIDEIGASKVPRITTTTTTPNTPEPFITLAHLALDRQEYLDSLIPPSSEEIIRIAGLQAIKEARNKRRDRIHRRIASEASLQRYRHDALGHYLGGSSSGVSLSSQHAGVILNPTHCRSTSTSTLSPARRNTPYPYDQGTKLTPIIQEHLYHNHNHNGELPVQKSIDASTRWTQAIREVRFRALTAPRSRSGLTADITLALPPAFVFDNNDYSRTEHSKLLSGLPKPLTARQRWKKAIAVACRAGFDSYAAGGDEGDDDYQSEMEYMSSDSSTSDSDSDSEKAKSKKANKRKEAANAKAKKCREEAKAINEMYILELVDIKHRYGLNLYVYHQVWKKSPTMENFFYWLDYGEGRFLDPAEGAESSEDGGYCCSREKLDREQIRYLSPEEQQLYLVVVGGGGRLCWARNGLPVDTDSERWRDSVNGIVAVDDDSAAPGYVSPWGSGSSSTSASASSSPCSSGGNSRVGSSWSGDSTYATSLSVVSDRLGASKDVATTPEKEKRTKTLTTRGNSRSKNKNKTMHKLKYGNSPASWLIDKFLRQQWGEKPWIFVADSAGSLYIGIKDSGSFQHTSFVRGSRVSAAGMISVKEGRITGLSPLSGHYRPPTRNFRAFVGRLRDLGVDLSSSSSNSAATSGGGGDGGGKGEEEDGDSSGKARGRGTTRGRGKGKGFNAEMRLCYGQDYWLLRGFEIYSGVRKVFGGGDCDDYDGRKELTRRGGDKETELKMGFLSVKKKRRPLLTRETACSVGKLCAQDEKGFVGLEVEDLEINSGSADTTQKMAVRKWWQRRYVSMPYLGQNV